MSDSDYEVYYKNTVNKKFYICNSCNLTTFAFHEEKDIPKCELCGEVMEESDAELTYIQNTHTATISC